MKTMKNDTLASLLDRIIERGGTWEQMEREGNLKAKSLRIKTKCTPSIIKAHIKYRQIKDDNYLSPLIVTNEGIFNPEEKTCPQCDRKFLRNKTFKLDKSLEQFFDDHKNYVNYDDSLCEYCLEEIKSGYEAEEMDQANDDFWEENNQWPGVDLGDYRGG